MVKVVDVALGVVGRGHRRIEAHEVRETTRAGVADLRRVDRRRRERRLVERHVAPARDGRRHRRLAGDHDGRERRLRMARDRQRGKGAGSREREERRCAARREAVVGHRLSDGKALGRTQPAIAGSACFPARGLPQSGSKGLSQSSRETSASQHPQRMRLDRSRDAAECYGKPGATPSSLCSFALVVVYCSGCARSGWTSSPIANAASVASWKPQTMSFCLPG